MIDNMRIYSNYTYSDMVQDVRADGYYILYGEEYRDLDDLIKALLYYDDSDNYTDIEELTQRIWDTTENMEDGDIIFFDDIMIEFVGGEYV